MRASEAAGGILVNADVDGASARIRVPRDDRLECTDAMGVRRRDPVGSRKARVAFRYPVGPLAGSVLTVYPSHNPGVGNIVS
jgi:hypothetical protein